MICLLIHRKTSVCIRIFIYVCNQIVNQTVLIPGVCHESVLQFSVQILKLIFVVKLTQIPHISIIQHAKLHYRCIPKVVEELLVSQSADSRTGVVGG